MDRDAWFEQKCSAIHHILGEKGRSMVGLGEPLAPLVQARAAAIISVRSFGLQCFKLDGSGIRRFLQLPA